MNRILQGILKYRANLRENLLKEFQAIKDNPKPSMLMFTCMDSRMLPTRFTQSHVGEVFVVRNAGNMIPKSASYGSTGTDVCVSTEPAAMELAVKRGGIRHVLICGHSDCKAINTLYQIYQSPKTFDSSSPMDHWVRANGYLTMQKLHQNLAKKSEPLLFECEVNPELTFEAIIDPLDKLAVTDKLSQINVLQQITNLSSHGVLRKYFSEGNLFVHGMWFDIYDGEVYLFSRKKKIFIQINECSVPALLAELNENVEDVCSESAVA
uniref:Carbonic anhydrase n=1 Tax=Panagrolaimus sp. JU765 TaxID=591449 RepID=A0AC34R2Q7_9BILA